MRARRAPMTTFKPGSVATMFQNLYFVGAHVSRHAQKQFRNKKIVGSRQEISYKASYG